MKALGKAVFADGQYAWSSGARATKDPNELAFPVGRFLSVAFMADGGAGETGSRMSFSSWYYFCLEERLQPRRTLFLPW